MPIRKNVFFDTKLNEWLFDKLVNLTADQRKNLNVYELRFLKNKSSIKAFVNNGNLEKKLSLLTKVGIEWNVTFFDNNNKPGELVQKVYRQYSMKGKTADAIDEMFAKKVFVLNSRDVAISMAMMSLNCHSESYMINPAFLSFKMTVKGVRAGANIGKMSQNKNVEHIEVFRETKNLAKLLIEASRVDDYLASQFNLQLLDAQILWLLYSMPYNYVSVDVIKRELASKYKPTSVGTRCSYLFKERHMIDKRAASESVATYLIAQEGINTIGMINNHLVNRVYNI